VLGLASGVGGPVVDFSTSAVAGDALDAESGVLDCEQEALSTDIRSNTAPARVSAVASGLEGHRILLPFAGIDGRLSTTRGAPLPNVRCCSQFERVNDPATGSNPATLQMPDGSLADFLSHFTDRRHAVPPF